MENAAMLIDINTDQELSEDKDAYYEAVASQEEIYLEETEEEERSILTADRQNRATLNGLVLPVFEQHADVIEKQEPMMDKEIRTKLRKLTLNRVLRSKH